MGCHFLSLINLLNFFIQIKTMKIVLPCYPYVSISLSLSRSDYLSQCLSLSLSLYVIFPNVCLFHSLFLCGDLHSSQCASPCLFIFDSVFTSTYPSFFSISVFTVYLYLTVFLILPVSLLLLMRPSIYLCMFVHLFISLHFESCYQEKCQYVFSKNRHIKYQKCCDIPEFSNFFFF